MNIRLSLTLLVFVAGSLLSACGSKDCETLCQDAQDMSCTSISGNCGAFCTSLEKISSAGNCGTQEDAYEACLNDAPTCEGDAMCSTQRDALGVCAGTYCAANSGNADCTVVSNALQ